MKIVTHHDGQYLRFMTMEDFKAEVFTRALVADAKARYETQVLPLLVAYFALFAAYGLCRMVWFTVTTTTSMTMTDVPALGLSLIGFVANTCCYLAFSRDLHKIKAQAKVSRQAAQIEAAMERQLRGYR